MVRNKSLIKIQREVKALQSTNFYYVTKYITKNVCPSWFMPDIETRNVVIGQSLVNLVVLVLLLVVTYMIGHFDNVKPL